MPTPVEPMTWEFGILEDAVDLNHTTYELLLKS